LFHSSDFGRCHRAEELLQPLLWARSASGPAGRPVWSIPAERHAQVDEESGIPLRLSGVLLCHVLSHAVEYVSGVCRCPGSLPGGDLAMDLPAALALGL